MTSDTPPTSHRHDVRLEWPRKRGVAREVVNAISPGKILPSALVRADNLDLLRWVAAGNVEQRDLPRLIYIDPPYAMNVDHGVVTESDAAAFAYADSWATDGAYCQFMFERLTLMREVLRDDGFIFVHCDWRASAWLRMILEEVFSRECFRNEIVWRRAPNLGRQAASRQLGRTTDSILVFSKKEKCEFPGQLPKLRKPIALGANGTPKGARWDAEKQAFFTTAPRGDYTDASIEKLRKEGRIYTAPTGKVYVKYFLESERASERTSELGEEDGAIVRESEGASSDIERWVKVVPLDTIWDDEGVRPVRHASKRELAVRYVTQKPESLLRRIIEWASERGDVVADFFGGSGTTAAAAVDTGRRFLLCEQGEVGFAATRKRLEERGATWNEYAANEPARAAHDGKKVPRVARGKASS